MLGAGFTGFMDELRISRRAVDDPVLSRFLGKTGTATTRIIDLGYSSTRIARIESVTTTPGDSGIEFSYQARRHVGRQEVAEKRHDWIPFVPGTDFGESLKARYIQVRVELYPDGTRTNLPRLSSLTVIYEPNLPPAPPAGLACHAGQRQGHAHVAQGERPEREGVRRFLRHARRATTWAREPPRVTSPSMRGLPRPSRSAAWRTVP